jgi:molecular chaperone GrpE
VSQPERLPDTEYDPERVVVRDKRRFDPVTGEPRGEAAVTPPPAAGAPAAPEAVPASDPVAELTADLQRLSAEYANYRKRVARDQAAVAELATAAVVDRLLPLLDDVDRAREHGDLDGAFKVVGEGLEAVVARLGVERYGVAGDPFDPQVHEAVMSAPEEPTATVATCVQVFAPGYRFAASGRVLRAAKVVVAEPGAAPQQDGTGAAESGTEV